MFYELSKAVLQKCDHAIRELYCPICLKIALAGVICCCKSTCVCVRTYVMTASASADLKELPLLHLSFHIVLDGDILAFKA